LTKALSPLFFPPPWRQILGWQEDGCAVFVAWQDGVGTGGGIVVVVALACCKKRRRSGSKQAAKEEVGPVSLNLE
jgi:hypothetical protein